MFVRVPGRDRRPLAWVSPLFVVLSVLAFVWLSGLPDDVRQAVLRRWGAVSLPGAPDLTAIAAWLPTLATALLIHADWLHLTGNLLFLLIFGLPAERVLGARRFAALFILGGALANAAALLALDGPRAVVVGCSGAVSALMGVYLALFPKARLGFVLPLGLFLEFVRTPASWLIGPWAALQLAFTVVGPGFGTVAWSAHLAGFVIGLLFGLFSRNAIARRHRHGRL